MLRQPVLWNPVLRGFARMYGFVSGNVRAGFQSGRRPVCSLPCRVISVGNLTTGGTGKTPMVLWICQKLQDNGLRVAILSRGYKGSMAKRGAVVSDGNKVLLSHLEAGDEPVLHACKLRGVPVLVGRDRVAMGLKACEYFGVQAVVLDDGFQYWRLRRDADIVLIDATDPWGNGQLLPAGKLREPLSELRRAAVVVMTKVNRVSADEREAIKQRLLTWLKDAGTIFEADHRPVDLSMLGRASDHCSSEASWDGGTEIRSLDWLRDRKIVAVCAIADGAGFIRLLQQLEAKVVRSFVFRDHHRFTTKDYKAIEHAALALNASIVTTEKDAVRWNPQKVRVAVWKLRIAMQVHQEDRFWSLIARAMGDVPNRVLKTTGAVTLAGNG